MHTLKKELWLLAILLVLSLPLFFLNIHDTHSAGGDDYALYIKEAQNIAEGKPFYQSNYVFNKYNDCYSPPQYPPGYPLLLAPVIKICGLSISALCYFNTIVAACLLVCFFFFFRKYMSTMAAVCLAVIISYSGIMIGLKQTIVADIACLLFAMLYLLLRQAHKASVMRSSLMGLCAAMAVLIRTQAILLPLAEVLLLLYYITTQLSSRKFKAKDALNNPSLIALGVFALLSLLFSKLIFPTPASASGFYVTFLGITLQKGILTIVRDNINFFLETIQAFFHYDTQNSIRTAIVTIMESAGLVLCITGFIISITRKLSFIDVFFMLMCGLMLYYPIHDARYFLPAIAIVFLYCYIALQKILPSVTTIRPLYLGMAFCAIYLFAGLKHLRETTLPPSGYVPEQKDYQAFSYLKQNVKPDELIVCARPRLVTLYTDRKCIIHAWQHPHAENKRVFDSMGAKYLLIAYGIVEDYYHEYLNNYQHPIDSTVIAEGYTLYKLR